MTVETEKENESGNELLRLQAQVAERFAGSENDVFLSEMRRVVETYLPLRSLATVSASSGGAPQ